jgi:hypothetical protein
VTRELVLLTFHNWGALTNFDVSEACDRARDNPGTRQRLTISENWFADITYEDGDYTLAQGRTMQGGGR